MSHGGDWDPLHAALPALAAPESAPRSLQAATPSPSPNASSSTAPSAPSAPLLAPAPIRAVPAASPQPPVSASLLHSNLFVNFRGNVSRKGIAVGKHHWYLYETRPSPAVSNIPIIFLPSTVGTAEHYYQQLLVLSAKGYHCLSVQWPPLWSVAEFVDAFRAFLDTLRIQHCHLFGASLGAFLAASFAGRHPDRIASLILCNAYLDTSPFVKNYYFTKSLYLMPHAGLSKLVQASLPRENLFPDSREFVLHHFHQLTQADIASRLTINSIQSNVANLNRIDQSRLSILEPQDFVTLPQSSREAVFAAFPAARQCLMKCGGDWPWLSQVDELNLLILVHLRNVSSLPLPSSQSQSEPQRPLSSVPAPQPPVSVAAPVRSSPTAVSDTVPSAAASMKSSSTNSSASSRAGSIVVATNTPSTASPGSTIRFFAPAKSIVGSDFPSSVTVSPKSASTDANATSTIPAAPQPKPVSDHTDKTAEQRAAVIAAANAQAEAYHADQARKAQEAAERREAERSRLEAEQQAMAEAERRRLEREREQQVRTNAMLDALMEHD